MPETPDPYKALDSKEVRDQAAGARDLARAGTWGDLELLIDRAGSSRSAAVRLYTAAAAGDIVHRARLAGDIDKNREQQLLGWVSGSNPDLSAGLLMLLSAVRDPRALDRIGRLIRDPRNGVRAGAAAALRRMALSRTAMDRTDLVGRVAEWLAHPKLTSDAALDLVNITGEVGWTDLADAIRPHARLSERHDEAVTTALFRLSDRMAYDTWAGVFRDRGLDVFELPTDNTPTDSPWLVVGRTSEARLDGEVVTVEPGTVLGEDARLVYAPPLGAPDERRRVLQTADRCFWEMSAEEQQEQLRDDPEVFPVLPEQTPNPTAALEGNSASELQALWAWRTGDLDTARAVLDELTAKGRPKKLLFYYLAAVAAEQDDVPSAALAAGTFLQREKRRSPQRDRAEALLERLTGAPE